MKNRFFVVYESEAKELLGDSFAGGSTGGTYDGESWCLLEKMDDGTHRLVGMDGGEPEDQLLIRDWAWVVTELNAQAKQIEKLKRVAKAADAAYDCYVAAHSDEVSDELCLALDSLNIKGSFHRINGVCTRTED